MANVRIWGITTGVPALTDVMELQRTADGASLKATVAAIAAILPLPAAPGVDTEVLFNDAAAIGAHAGLKYSKTTNTLTLGVASSATGVLKLAQASSAFLTTIQAGAALAARTYIWPTDFGSAGYVLTDAAGDGVLSWAASGGGGTPGGSDTQVQFNDATVFGGNAAFTFDKTTGHGAIGIGSSRDAPINGLASDEIWNAQTTITVPATVSTRNIGSSSILNINLSGPRSASQSVTGVVGFVQNDGVNGVSHIQGGQFYAWAADGTITSLIGIEGSADSYGGTFSDALYGGSYSAYDEVRQIYVSGAESYIKTDGTAWAFESFTIHLYDAQTLPSMGGLHIATVVKDAGTITNVYGVKVDDQNAGATNYSCHFGAGKYHFDDLSASQVVLTDASKNLVSGGTLGTAAFTASTAYDAAGAAAAVSALRAAADGTTFGLASFTAADFDAAAGVISIDYTNAQKATASVPGFLTAADWTTFNSKQAALTLGTGVSTALAVNVGSAGAFVTNNVANTLTGNLTLSSAALITSGNISAAAWTTNGIRTKFAAASYTDTSSSGTVAAAYTDLFGAGTILASGATTYTDYYATYIAAPVASTNVTMTRKWSLGLEGSLLVGDTLVGGSGGVRLNNGGGLAFYDTQLTSSNKRLQMDGNKLEFMSSGVIGWNPSSPISGGDDLFLSRAAAATLQHGAADAASPIAQTVQAQGSRSGTDSNVGGANLTVRSGNGTGTGTPSTLILQSPVAVASGTGAQTQTTGLTIKVGVAVLTNYTVANLPAAATAGAGATAFVTDSTTTLALGLGLTVAGGGSNKVPVYSDATNWIIG